MSISNILRLGLAEAKGSGAKQLELQHLSEDGVDELANETLAFLRGRPGRPSSVNGWNAVAPSNTGVIAWWAREAGLTTEAQRRTLGTLRRQTYDLLDERGLIVKPVGPSAVVDVSPAPVAEAEPIKSKAGKAAPTTTAAPRSKPATQATRPPTIEPAGEEEAAAASESVGAWILRLDPVVWNLARFIADGHHEVTAWAVEDNQRSAAMTRGQRVFLWAGGDGTLITPGVWGAGWVVGPCESKAVEDGYWVDPAGNSQRGLFADVSVQLLPRPVGRQQVVDDSRLAAIEVLRDPSGSNPSSITPDEAAAMLELVGLEPLLPD